MLLRVAELYKERIDDLAALITREMGKPTREAKGEIQLVISIYRYYAEQGPALLEDVPLSPRAGGTALVRKEPVGPLLGIMPWNFPYYQVARLAAPNLMVGNTIILKHAPQCPESALAMEQIFHDAGLLDGAYINVFATNSQIADMIADPRVSGVSVTGSERAGAAVAEVAGRNLKKVVLELGGSDPFIVLDSDDVTKTVQAAVGARMLNAGQACNAAKRIIVVGDLYSEFVDQFSAAMAALHPGDPADPASDFGPLSSEGAAELLMGQIRDAVDKGATLRTGGQRLDRPGAFVEPTVLTDVTPQMRAYREELFGPAAVVYRVADASEAIELANSSVVRARGRRLQRGPGPGRGSRGPARHRHGVDQQPAGLHGRPAVRRDQALRRRPGAGPGRHRGVRQQEADLHPSRTLTRPAPPAPAAAPAAPACGPGGAAAAPGRSAVLARVRERVVLMGDRPAAIGLAQPDGEPQPLLRLALELLRRAAPEQGGRERDVRAGRHVQ